MERGDAGWSEKLPQASHRGSSSREAARGRRTKEVIIDLYNTERRKMKIDLDQAREAYGEAVQSLIDKYGDATSIPRDEWYDASEKLRASYAIHANPDMPVVQVLKHYSVDHRIWTAFADDSDIVPAEKKMTRAEKVASVISWAAGSVGDAITLEKLMETHSIAYSMAKKITEDRPDVFRKVKRGHFEIRDPKADREADKVAAEEANKEESDAE